MGGSFKNVLSPKNIHSPTLSPLKNISPNLSPFKNLSRQNSEDGSKGIFSPNASPTANDRHSLQLSGLRQN